MAKKNGLDINEVAGTGKGGRVTKEDIINFMSGKTKPKAMDRVEQPSGSAAMRAPSQPPLSGVTTEDEVKKITGIQKAMTKTMTQSLSIPTFTFSDDMDATQLIKLRKELK
jgi:pyruvate/2-oxoglutarate dehydrogenase complex dihydrolipoamide acyltransferase (E2) component